MKELGCALRIFKSLSECGRDLIYLKQELRKFRGFFEVFKVMIWSTTTDFETGKDLLPRSSGTEMSINLAHTTQSIYTQYKIECMYIFVITENL